MSEAIREVEEEVDMDKLDPIAVLVARLAIAAAEGKCRWHDFCPPRVVAFRPLSSREKV